MRRAVHAGQTPKLGRKRFCPRGKGEHAPKRLLRDWDERRDEAPEPAKQRALRKRPAKKRAAKKR